MGMGQYEKIIGNPLEHRYHHRGHTPEKYSHKSEPMIVRLYRDRI